MKKTIMIILALAGSMSAADYTGVWNGKGGREDIRYGTVPQTAQMALIQAGNSLTGSMKLGKGTSSKISSGTVSGSQVTFAIVSQGGQVTARLTQTGAQLTGKVTTSTGQVYDFVFTKN